MIELQKIDCNCNDCIFMVRDSVKFRQSLELHKKWSLELFEGRKQLLTEIADEYRLIKGDLEKWSNLLKERDKMRFQFDKKEVSINYGDCSKLNKPVTFIAGVLQLETQECFTHRRN